MKSKNKSKKILSLLLALIMIAGTVPLSAVTAFAAMPTDSASWITIGGDGTTESDTELFNQLREAMSAGGDGTRYIRLGEDIDYASSSGYEVSSEHSIFVRGDVVFDLNGYRLESKITIKDLNLRLSPVWGTENITYNLFEIGQRPNYYDGKDHKLTVVDSRGKGEIHTDGYISSYEETSRSYANQVFNIFNVNEQAELIINASGATFRCGRSKKQWVSDEAHYTYNQICGSVVVLRSNTKLTVAGGKLQARGYNAIYKNTFSKDNRCAAIYTLKRGYEGGFEVRDATNVNINIIDGTFYGKGCADALSITPYDSNKVTIRSGTFDVFKLERVVVGAVSHDPKVVGGSYGEIGIPDDALDMNNSDIVIGGHNYSEDEDKDNSASDTHKTTTIKPKSNTKTPDDRILVENENGINSWNGEDSFVIKAKNGRAYFSDSDSAYLENDLQDSTFRYYLWTFTLYNAQTGEACNADPIERAYIEADRFVSFDITDFRSINGASAYRFESDKIDSYKIKAEVQEVWTGHHTYKPKFFNWFYVNEYSQSFTGVNVVEAAAAFDFSVTPEEYSTSTTNMYNITTENEEGMEYYFEFLEKNSRGTLTCNTYYRYCMLDSAGRTSLSPKQVIKTGTEYGENVEFGVSNHHGGPVYVTVEYVLKRSAYSTLASGVVTVSVTHPVYALNRMRYDLVTYSSIYDRDLVRETGAVTGAYEPVELGENNDAIIIKPNITADMTKFDTKDPLTGKTFDASDIKWQFSVDSDDYGKFIWNDVPDYEIVDYNVDGVTLPCVRTSRSAVYRMYYEWNGQTVYSPQPMLFKGISYEYNRIATVKTGDEFTGIYGKGANKLYLDINRDADWYTGGCTVDSIRISMMTKPSGAVTASTMKTLTDFTVDENGLIELVNTDNFFENSAGAVTGKYTFRVRVTGTNSDGTTYKVTTNRDVWYSQKTTDLNVYVNGTPIYEHDGINVPYILPADGNAFDFTYGYYPLNTQGNNIKKNSIKWTSSNSGVLKIDENTGRATALTPGTVTVNCSWTDEDGTVCASAARVSVPIAGFEINEIDYSPYVGQTLSEIDTGNVATVKSVWAYGGEKVTQNVSRYMTVELTSWNGNTSGGVNFQNATVSYNGDAYYGYTLTANVSRGYFFPVTVESDDTDIEYYVDTNLLQCNGLDNGEILSAEDYEAFAEWNMPYTVHIDYTDNTFEAMYADSMYIRLKHQPVTEDPDAVYLNEVNITVSEPAVGDNRYEGTTYDPMNEYLVLNVDGVLGSRKTDISCSYVSKLDIANMRGTGMPYDDASSEEAGALAVEYMSVWNTNSDYSEWYKPTKTYENGIYVHDVRLVFDGDGDSTDGSKVYVAKDANVFVNGRRIDYANVSYGTSKSSNGYGDSFVTLKYYFDVGEVSTVSSIDIDGIQPRQGDLPYKPNDAKLSSSFKDGTDASDKLEVESIEWFVDANNNGVFDKGEAVEAKFLEDGTYDAKKSTLWWDGTFLPGVEYSAHIEIGSDLEAMRFATDISVNCRGSEPVFDTSTSFNVKFGGDYYIRKISIKTSEGEDAAYPAKRDPLNLAKASKAFDITTVGVYKHWPYDGTTAYANIRFFYGSGNLMGDNLTEGKYFHEFSVTMKDSDYILDEDATVFVNGKNYGEAFASDRNEIAVERSERSLTGIYCFSTSGAVDVTLGGTVTSFGKNTDDVIIQLTADGEREPAYEVVVKGNSTTYSLSGIPGGKYKIAVMKNGHVAKSIVEDLYGANVTLDLSVNLIGDVNLDGAVDVLDVREVELAANEHITLEGYRFTVADMNGDKEINVQDYSSIVNTALS